MIKRKKIIKKISSKKLAVKNSSKKVVVKSSMEKENFDNLKIYMQKIATFAGNIASSNSTFIFLPKRHEDFQKNSENILELVSYSSKVEIKNTNITISTNSSIIGYVARHKQPIHISPFDKDSKHIGLNYTEEKLQSILALPIIIDEYVDNVGVLYSDSKEPFAFSNKQCALLNELTYQIASFYKLHRLNMTATKKLDWHSFIKKSNELIATLKPNCIDILRMKLTNLVEIEAHLGTGKTIAIIEMIERLIAQSIPPESTMFRLPSGDIVVILDNMITEHIKNKISAIIKKISFSQKTNIALEFSKRSCKALKHQEYKLEDLISGCRKNSTTKNQK
ncbi:MAG: GAF domain-containing protein [Bdellovibrionota bacterium]